MTKTLTTARLRLRPCESPDVDALHTLWRDPDVRRYLLDDREISRAEAAAFISDFLQAAEAHGLGLWMVELPGDGTLVGFAALRQIENTPHVEVYYGLAPAHWGSGYATEAARALLNYGFDVLGLERIWARTDTPNAASMRVAKRLGMQPADDPGGTSLVSYVIERARFTTPQ
jgi:RimJ/RimL family protein N-acetyltransferase